MLKFVCPNCQHTSTLSQPKEGKFAGICHYCNSKLSILIQSQSDGTFSSKVKLLSPAHQHRITPVLPNENVGRNESTEAPPPNGDSVEPKSNLSIGSNLGSYRLVKLLGQGGMGEVYLARQTSLDRDVALKVINIRLSESPRALARFTREAYAAAQLVHPNIVQVYDMGDDRGYCYFSMEYVSGHTLAELVADEKNLKPEQAASYILQAARGLSYAHAAGMVHRDIKPRNLLIDEAGVVKVADLGLVKVPDEDDLELDQDVADLSALSASQDLTRFGSALGTPYYMAPEQARNAVNVDHRADIYSLGCTFYVLLTGQKPFDGKTFEEIVKKHDSAQFAEPSRLVKQVPSSLSEIVTKMMAKDPIERYQSMIEVISELEKFMGIGSPAQFVPAEEDVKILEGAAAAFNGVKLVAVRSLIPAAMVAGCLFLSFSLSFLSWRWASSFLVMPVFSVIVYFLIAGSRENSSLFSLVRELVSESGVLSWLKWLMTGTILVGGICWMGLYLPWFFAAMVSTALAIAYFLLIDRSLIATREKPLKEAEQLLRKMRLKGMDESAIQMFVAKYSGRHWEEFFEHLFDYETKRRIRDDLEKSGTAKSGPKFWAWRDRWFDAWSSRLRKLKAAKERKHIERVEFAGFKAEGLSAVDAQEKAGQMAVAIVDQVAEKKIAALEKRIAELDPEFGQQKKRDQIKQLLADARSGKYRQKRTRVQQLEPTLNRYVGGFIRFLIGSLFIVGSFFWARQNGILAAVQDPVSIIRQAMNSERDEEAANASDDDARTELAVLKETLNRETTPLDLPLFGKWLFRDFNSLIAGLILVASSMVSGWRMTLFAVPAACIALFGSFLISFDLEATPLIHSISILIAVGGLLLGIVFGRAED